MSQVRHNYQMARTLSSKLKLIEQAELLEDIRDFDEMSAAIERGEEELIPAEVVNAILEGKNPIKVWREYRSFGSDCESAGCIPGTSSEYRKGITTNLPGPDGLTSEIVEPMQRAVLRHASRVQPSQRHVGGLVRREEGAG